MKKLILVALGFTAVSAFASNCSFEDEFAIPSKVLFGEKSVTAAIAQPLHEGGVLVTSVVPWKAQQRLVLDSEDGLIALEGEAGTKSAVHQDFLKSVYPIYATFGQYPNGYNNVDDICLLHSTARKMQNREPLLSGDEFVVSDELLRQAITTGGKLEFVVSL
jgi:hypothetical protein